MERSPPAMSPVPEPQCRPVGLPTICQPPSVNFLETVVKTPGLSSPCTMECSEGLLTAFGVGFTPHIQRQARTDLRLRAYAIDVALHLTVAPVTALHGIGCGGQQPIIEKRQGFFQGGRIELLQRVTQEWEAPKTPPQLSQFVESCLGPTAPIEQRIHLVHDCP